MKIDGYEKRTLLTKQEAAEILRVSIRKIEYMIDEGKLDSVQLGYRTIRIPTAEVTRIIEKK